MCMCLFSSLLGGSFASLEPFLCQPCQRFWTRAIGFHSTCLNSWQRLHSCRVLFPPYHLPGRSSMPFSLAVACQHSSHSTLQAVAMIFGCGFVPLCHLVFLWLDARLRPKSLPTIAMRELAVKLFAQKAIAGSGGSATAGWCWTSSCPGCKAVS